MRGTYPSRSGAAAGNRRPQRPPAPVHGRGAHADVGSRRHAAIDPRLGTGEIGTMRALGAQRNEIRNLFLCEAMFLGIAGIVPGFCVGMAALFTIRLFRFEAFPELALFLDGGHLAFAVSPLLLALSALTVIIVTLLAAVFPARKAARMEPATALRTQL